ncbi:hypothetical protein DASC09_031540 [Saccharomycopsis crataegensis]|uniref:Chloride channel protein n=1 Tax=Saccharomycopsis crataegensis TaxID=43959 RepID=A0AAV5QM69_9ASCO|nr:hypothetical protein DASC09_031540 [Saccharomycopsis crataegensis]
MEDNITVQLPKITPDPPLDNIYTARTANNYDDSPFFNRLKTYTRFQEIDWLHEYKKERQLSKSMDIIPGISGTFRRMQHTGEKWVVIIASALLTGVIVSVIDISSIWVNDLRNGYCKTNFLQSKITCCNAMAEGIKCENWHDWDFSSNSFGHFLIYVLTAVVLSIMAFVITRRHPNAAKSGIGEIKMIICGLIFDEFLSFGTLFAKTASLILVVGAGLWVGKEGPLVHVSCCIMSLVSWIISRHSNEALKRELLAAGVAAGIAVAFNAPIGGVLFVIEQGYSNLRINNIMWKSFICATIAVVVLQSLHPFTDGRNVVFTVSNNKDWLSVEIFPFMILGVLGGVYGALFSKLNFKFAEYRSTHFQGVKKSLLEILMIAVVTTILTYPLIFGKLPLSLLITRLFRDCEANDSTNVIGGLCSKIPGDFQLKAFTLLIFTGIEGFVLATYTYGTLLPTGVLMPSLAIGGCFGRSLGLIVDYLQTTHPHWKIFANCPAYVAPDAIATSSCISTGAYAVIGAASFLAGITKNTVSVVVIMFELTGALTYVLPIMISVLIAKVINDSIVVKNFYEKWLRFSSFHFLDQNFKDLKPMPNISASQVATVPQFIFYLHDTSGITVQSLVDILEEVEEINAKNRANNLHNISGFPVLASRSKPTLIGWISKNELQVELDNISSLPQYNYGQKVTFKPGGKKFQLNYGRFSEFEISDDDEDQGLVYENNNSEDALSLNHVLETCDVIPVFKATLPLTTLTDLFYKVNFNYILLTNFHGEFQGVITKYQMIDIVESGFRDTHYGQST